MHKTQIITFSKYVNKSYKRYLQKTLHHTLFNVSHFCRPQRYWAG